MDLLSHTLYKNLTGEWICYTASLGTTCYRKHSVESTHMEEHLDAFKTPTTVHEDSVCVPRESTSLYWRSGYGKGRNLGEGELVYDCASSLHEAEETRRNNEAISNDTIYSLSVDGKACSVDDKYGVHCDDQSKDETPLLLGAESLANKQAYFLHTPEKKFCIPSGTVACVGDVMQLERLVVTEPAGSGAVRLHRKFLSGIDPGPYLSKTPDSRMRLAWATQEGRQGRQEAVFDLHPYSRPSTEVSAPTNPTQDAPSLPHPPPPSSFRILPRQRGASAPSLSSWAATRTR